VPTDRDAIRDTSCRTVQVCAGDYVETGDGVNVRKGLSVLRLVVTEAKSPNDRIQFRGLNVGKYHNVGGPE